MDGQLRAENKQFLAIKEIAPSHFAGDAIDLHVYMRLTAEICITNVKEERKKDLIPRNLGFLAITIHGIYRTLRSSRSVILYIPYAVFVKHLLLTSYYYLLSKCC
jgi:hypothetical protein